VCVIGARGGGDAEEDTAIGRVRTTAAKIVEHSLATSGASG